MLFILRYQRFRPSANNAHRRAPAHERRFCLFRTFSCFREANSISALAFASTAVFLQSAPSRSLVPSSVCLLFCFLWPFVCVGASPIALVITSSSASAFCVCALLCTHTLRLRFPLAPKPSSRMFSAAHLLGPAVYLLNTVTSRPKPTSNAQTFCSQLVLLLRSSPPPPPPLRARFMRSRSSVPVCVGAKANSSTFHTNGIEIERMLSAGACASPCSGYFEPLGQRRDEKSRSRCLRCARQVDSARRWRRRTIDSPANEAQSLRGRAGSVCGKSKPELGAGTGAGPLEPTARMTASMTNTHDALGTAITHFRCMRSEECVQ